MCLWGVSLSLKLIGRSLLLLEYILELHCLGSRRNSPSNHLPFVSYLWDFKLEFLIIICSSSDHPYLLWQNSRPNTWFWALNPTRINGESNLYITKSWNVVFNTTALTLRHISCHVILFFFFLNIICHTISKWFLQFSVL